MSQERIGMFFRLPPSQQRIVRLLAAWDQRSQSAIVGDALADYITQRLDTDSRLRPVLDPAQNSDA